MDPGRHRNPRRRASDLHTDPCRLLFLPGDRLQPRGFHLAGKRHQESQGQEGRTGVTPSPSTLEENSFPSGPIDEDRKALSTALRIPHEPPANPGTLALADLRRATLARHDDARRGSMCKERECEDLGRRTFLKATGAATAALGLTGGTLLAGSARADALTRAQRDKMTPEQILDVMREGNERFRRGERKDRNYLREQQASAKGQYPAAVLLSCI